MARFPFSEVSKSFFNVSEPFNFKRINRILSDWSNMIMIFWRFGQANLIIILRSWWNKSWYEWWIRYHCQSELISPLRFKIWNFNTIFLIIIFSLLYILHILLPSKCLLFQHNLILKNIMLEDYHIRCFCRNILKKWFILLGVPETSLYGLEVASKH